MRTMDDGTPRALQPLAHEVLAWVARERKHPTETGDFGDPAVDPDDLRRIELCAQAVINLDRLVSSFTVEGVCTVTWSGDRPAVCPVCDRPTSPTEGS